MTARSSSPATSSCAGSTFGYSPLDPPLIEDFNLVIEPGQRVALVGGSGSGKSTVAKLVSGLYEPWRGEVLFDDVPRAETAAHADHELARRGRPGGVPVRRHHHRERDHVGRARSPPRASPPPAGTPRIEEVVEERRGSATTPCCEEGGKNFSGGQRQRLEIARALVGEPTIVVLDEATSALDPTTETWIDESLRRRGCTCIIIAHRLEHHPRRRPDRRHAAREGRAAGARTTR